MPAITITGLKGISLGLKEFGPRVNLVADRTISAVAQEARARLQQDTPVRTGRLLRSTVLRKDSALKQTLGQFAPYANIVNNRRGYWQGAITVAQKWPPFFASSMAAEVATIGRQFAGQ